MLLFLESFDHLSAAQLTRKWQDALDPQIGVGEGRNGTNCLKFPWSTFPATPSAQVTFGYKSEVIIGMALKVDSPMTPYWGAGQTFFTIERNGVFALGCFMQPSGVLTFWADGTPDKSYGDTSFVFTADTWYYIEVRYKIGQADGVVEVKVDGEQVLLFEGDTRPAADLMMTEVNQLVLRANGKDVAAYARFDDIYVCDTVGTACNSFLGDIHIKCLYPRADVAAAWARTAGAANFGNIDEPNAMDEADMVSSGEVDATDLYRFTEIIGQHTIKGVQLVAMTQKSGAGTRAIALLADPGADGASVDEGDPLYVHASWNALRRPMEVNPDTGTPWTPEVINAAAFGLKVKV